MQEQELTLGGFQSIFEEHCTLAKLATSGYKYVFSNNHLQLLSSSH